MAQENLHQYKGRLSAEQVAEGINAATSNAARLVEDANLLLSKGRFPSATSLAILAIEEAGKVAILRALVVAKDDQAVSRCWCDYRSHTKKNVAWLLPQLVSEGARRLKDFRSLFRKGADLPFILDKVKQISFYTDCLGEAHWSIPKNVIDESLAGTLIRVAETLSKASNTSSQEIELWVKHIGPVWMSDLDSMQRALADWYADMQRHNLAPGGSNKMEEFIYRGFS
jgi:AbiV family abortive infection protein